jgi:hypothetical protein
MIPILLIWEYYPKAKGFYGGILLSAYGLGPCLFI